MVIKVGVILCSILVFENCSIGCMSVLDDVLIVFWIVLKVVFKSWWVVFIRNGLEYDKVYILWKMVRDVVEYFLFFGIVLELCWGDGSFFEVFFDDVDVRWCELDEGCDFFDWYEWVDWIISNLLWLEFWVFNVYVMLLVMNVVWIILLVYFSSRVCIRDVCELGFGFKEMLLFNMLKEWF